MKNNFRSIWNVLTQGVITILTVMSIMLGFGSDAQAAVDIPTTTNDASMITTFFNPENDDSSFVVGEESAQEISSLLITDFLREHEPLYTKGSGVCYGYEKPDGTCGVQANNCTEGSPVVPESPPCGCRCE